jgi:hypothetical protein
VDHAAIGADPDLRATVNTRPGALPLSWSPAINGSVEKPGVYVWQLPVALPLERMKVASPNPTAWRPARCTAVDDSNAPWQLIDSGLLYRLTQNGQDVVQDEMELPGDVVQQLKLEVDDRGGGLGNDAPKLSFAVRATQVVFLGRGAPPYSVAIGNATIKGANLPLSTLVPGVTQEKLGSLGSAKLTVHACGGGAAPPVAAGLDWKRIGLWSVLVLGVFFWAGWRLARYAHPAINKQAHCRLR